MEAYHETRTLDRPAALVRATFDDDARFHPDSETEDGSDTAAAAGSRWVARRGPYRTTAELDAATGDLRVSVALPEEYGSGAVLILLAVVGALALGAPPWTFLPALWGGVALTLLPVGHLLVGPLPETPGVHVVDRGLTATTLAPYAATALALFGTLRGVVSPPLAAAPVAVLAAVGAGAYLLAGTGRRVTALDVPLSGLLAPLVAATNLFVAGALLRDARSPALAVGLAGALALALGALFPAYCRLALRRFRAAQLTPIARRYRALAALGYGALTLVLAGSVAVALLAVIAGGDLPLVGDAVPLAPGRAVLRGALGSDLAVAGFTLLLVAPLAWLAVGWVAHLGWGVGARLLALARSEPVRGDRFDSGEGGGAPLPVPVRVVPTDRPLVRPVAVAGVWRGVLVGRPVAEALAADELRAVVAHEAHHLGSRDLTAAAVATLAGLGFGGRNALLAFYDYAAAERAADERAADTVGTDAVVRALRRLEGLQTRGAGNALADGSGGRPPAGRSAHGAARSTWRLLRAPYDLFFGRVLLDAAHRSVDERVRHLRDRE
jgi:Zn-dependent protease with chaperone function